MENLLLIAHPDLRFLEPHMKKYSHLSSSGAILEYWIKDEKTGQWKNITEEEQLKREIIEAQKELDKLNSKAVAK